VQIQDFARRLAAVAVAAVDPERLVREELARRGIHPADQRFAAVLALGKAAAGLARGTRSALPSRGPRRLLVRPHTSPALLDPGWEQAAGGHPVPDRQSLAAGERVARWLAQMPADGTLLALVSGGASACIEMPAPGLSLEDVMATQRALLASGLPISAVNAVRKHLSGFKGGGALRRTSGRVLALLLSDVPGDDPATIASGPFTADPTTYAEALAAVQLLDIPEAVRRHLLAGVQGDLPETVKPGDPLLSRVETVLVGGNGTAVAATGAELRRRGLAVFEGALAGEASRAARDLVTRGRALGDAAEGIALVLGGETTVTLPAGAGRGGRNGELALAAAKELAAGAPAGQTEVVFALATDGEDGTTRYAGAVASGGTWEAARRAGIDPEQALARHDAYRALAAVTGAALETGPTGTNVADLAVYVRGMR
jgi:hydroxypyruvate reductase